MPPAPPVIKIVLLVSFIVKYPSKLWDHRQSCEEALRRSTQTQRPPNARGDRASGRRTPSSRDRDTRHDREDCPRPSRMTRLGRVRPNQRRSAFEHFGHCWSDECALALWLVYSAAVKRRASPIYKSV